MPNIWKRRLIFYLCFLLLTGCSGRGPLFRPDVPTIGPLQAGGSRPDFATMTLKANTNCADIGGEIVIRVTITNNTKVLLIITGSPEPDIVIEPMSRHSATAASTERWSTTALYPRPMRSLQPNEERIFTWQWRVPATYTTDNVRNVRIQWIAGLSSSAGETPISAGTDLIVGIGAVDFGNGGRISCAEMRTVSTP